MVLGPASVHEQGEFVELRVKFKVTSILKHFLVLVKQCLDQLLALNHLHVSCPANHACHTVVYNLEVDVQSIQIAAIQRLQNVVRHPQVGLPVVTIFADSLHAHLNPR